MNIYVLLQALYDYTASLAQPAVAASNSQRLQTAQPLMPLLHVEGFDAEQIWLQLDMASAHFVRRARRLLKKAGNEPELLTPEMDEDLEGEWQTLAAFFCSGTMLHNPCVNPGTYILDLTLHALH